MRFSFIFLLLIITTVGCKVQQKKPVSKESAVLDRGRARESKPVVSSINGKYNFVDSTSAKVFLLVNFDNLAGDISFEKLNKIFRVQWSILPEYGTKERLKSGKLEFSEKYVTKTENAYQMTFDVPKLKDLESAVLVMDFIDIDAATKYTYDLPIDFYAKKVDTRYLLYDKESSEFPNFTPYLFENETFVVKSINPSIEKLYLKRYSNNSLPALSPMSAGKRDPLAEFEALETLEIIPGKATSIKDKGVYVLTQDPDNHTDGYGFMVVGERFPRDTEADALRASLVYMSTPKEIEELKTTEDPKEALDMYFLNVSKGNQAMAKQLIKTYYKRVADANKLFTSYKEGWKTDKGMVFVIMGPPSRVQRNRQREVWLYAQNSNNSEIIFTFYRKSNAFTDQNFELVRYPEYSSFWYPFVDAWRTGNVVE
ncbi:GWxTD domain-containing protein [Lacihabitans sp. LS3-19]|uniref:GWxTD domain-containing protein n=1 Tax=Lacihabitans sp. LS3-19 TaxID=2487335 RepID=UPI0020CF398C|nr:GWxTD domain-containing protein [Lacihabitans sp. LS3-19]MCP9767404.1 GWxTD domain-containing protein [Lacihabitans sp. LS3-19]